MAAKQGQVSSCGAVLWSIVVQTLRRQPTTTNLHQRDRGTRQTGPADKDDRKGNGNERTVGGGNLGHRYLTQVLEDLSPAQSSNIPSSN